MKIKNDIIFREEYVEYLRTKSLLISSESRYYDHAGLMNILTDPLSFGYKDTKEDILLVVDKGHIIVGSWGADLGIEVESYTEFIRNKQLDKLI